MAARGTAAAAEPPALRPQTKEGFLVKQGHLWRSWKRRFFSLRHDSLCYYERVGDKTPRGVIPLENATVELPGPGDDKKPFLFIVTSSADFGRPKRFLIQAASDGEREVRVSLESAPTLVADRAPARPRAHAPAAVCTHTNRSRARRQRVVVPGEATLAAREVAERDPRLARLLPRLLPPHLHPHSPSYRPFSWMRRSGCLPCGRM